MSKIDGNFDASSLQSNKAESGLKPVIEIPPRLARALEVSINSRETVSQEINSLNDLPFEQALGIYSRVVGENTNMDGMSWAASLMIDQLNSRLRGMRNHSQPLELTQEQTQLVQGFFDQLRTQLPNLRRSANSYREGTWRSNLHSLVNQNTEVGVMTAPLFGDMVAGRKSKEQVSNMISDLDALPLEQAVSIFTRIVNENTDMDGMSWAAGQMIDQLSGRLRSLRKKGEPLQLSLDQTQLIQGFFEQLRTKLPDLRRSNNSYREGMLRDNLHNLVGQNAEIGPLAAQLYGDTIVSAKNKDQVGNAISGLDVFPFEQALGIYTRVIAENTDMDGMSWATYQMIDRLNGRLREMRNHGQPLVLTTDQTQLVSGFFDQMRAQLPNLRHSTNSYREGMWRSSLHGLISQNSELGALAAPVFGDMVSGRKTKEQVGDSITTLDALPFEQAVGIFSRIVTENTDMDGMSWAAGQMIDQLNNRLGSMRRNGQPLQLSNEQSQLVQNFFEQLRAQLPNLRRSTNSYREGSWLSNLHSLVNRNAEVGEIAGPFFGDMVAGPKGREQITEAIPSLEVLPFEQALGIYSRVVGENTNMDGMSWAASLMIDQLNSRLRGMRNHSQPLELTQEQTQLVQGFFDQLRTQLPNLRRSANSYREGTWRSNLHSLVNQNPEISEQARELLEKIGKEANEALVDRVATYIPTTPTQQVQRVIDRGIERVVTVTRSIDRYHGLNRVLQSLPSEARQTLVKELNNSLANDELANTRISILDGIVSAKASNELHMDRILQRLNVQLDQLPDIMSDSTVTNLLTIMADDPDRYKFQIGVLLSQIPVDKLPDALTQKLKPTLANLEFKINVGHESWWLCGEAEPRLLRCLSNGAAVLVNDFLLVKFDGKFSALCVKTTSVPNGQTFVEGNWYSPTARDLKANIRLGFDNGSSRLTIPSGDWAMIRPLSRDQSSGLTPSEILEQSQKYAASMPARLPDRIGGISRSDYRQRREEVHG